MSLLGKNYFNIFNIFIIVVVYTKAVTSNVNGNTSINYNDIRDDDQLFGVQPKQVRTTREILEMHSEWAIHRHTYTLQQATEHLLNFGALLRIQILDLFGALVYDHYDDYSFGQTEALYRVYQETFERKYNIFNIVPSVLAHLDMRPTAICRYIHRHVRTCLKESSMMCTTIQKHDNANIHTSLTPVLNMTRRLYKISHIKRHFPDGFSLPGILKHLEAGTLKLTTGLLSGLLHHVEYDNFDDEVRTAEKNVLIILTSEMLGDDQDKVLMDQTQLQYRNTLGEVLKKLFEDQQKIYDGENKRSFAILSKHVIREVEAISRNVELLGMVYENNTIDMKYLLNLVLPPDVVHDDITEAKDYMLQKINDYDIVRKYLKVEKYQQSGPDQLLMEILGQMRTLNFTVDLATALHVHARFWHQSRMVNNLNELLELFDAYENLRNVPAYSSLMMLMDNIRNTLWNSKNVTVEILCNNPRACLRLGLDIVAECVLINFETKNNIEKLFLSLHKSGAIRGVDKCQLTMPEVTEKPQTTENPTIFAEVVTTTKLPTVKTTVPTIDQEETGVMLTIDGNILKATTKRPATTEPTTTEASTEWVTISTEYTTSAQSMTDFTDDEQASTQVTTETESTEELSTELTTEEFTTTVHTAQEPTTEEKSTYEITTEEQTTANSAEQSASTEEFIITTTDEIKTTPSEVTSESMTTANNCDASDCTSEISSKGTDALSTDMWDIDSSPHVLSDKIQTTKWQDVPTTTSIPMTSKDSDPSTFETDHISTTISEQITTPKSNRAVLSKKPKTYSVGSSNEDCSEEGCASDDCSGERCSSNSSPEETSIACDDSYCDFDTSEPSSEEDCSIGDDCLSAPGGCKGEECSTQQSPKCIGNNCTKVPLRSISIPNCIGAECLELPKSNESICDGLQCPDRDERRPSGITEKTDPSLPRTGASLAHCDNKDPHHQRKLDKLKKIRLINALQPVARVPTAYSKENVDIGVNGGDSNELDIQRPIRPAPIIKHQKLLHSDLPPWLQLPKHSQLNRPSPWRQTFSNLIQTQKIKKQEIKQSPTGYGIRSPTLNRTNTNINMNKNINSINFKRYLTSGLENASTPVPLVLRKVRPPNSGYQRVLTRISSGLSARGEWDKKNRGRFSGNLKPDVPSDETSESSKTPVVSSIRTNPVVYQRQQSDDDIELVDKK